MEPIRNPSYVNKTKITFLDLSINEWHEIPTHYNSQVGGAEISRLQLPFRGNIRVDILYNGDIQTIDERIAFDSATHSYHTQNPVFHSEFLHKLAEGCYRFETSYPQVRLDLGNLSKATKLTKPDEKIRQRRNEVNPELLRKLVGCENNLELVLANLCRSIGDSAATASNKSGWYDFLTRYKELETTGRFSGNCREVSTITAGLLNALGLKSKILGSSIMENIDGEYEFGGLHSFTEVYFPVNKRSGFWLLIDPATGLTYNSTQEEREKYIYLFTAELPLFSDMKKSAKIRIGYI